MANAPNSLTEAKRNLRSEMQIRRQIAHGLVPNAAVLLRDQVLQNISFPKGSRIASYYNIGSEISPHLLVRTLRERGHTILLPVIENKMQPLKFRNYSSDHGLVPSWHGIMEPPLTAEIDEPDILFVPLLAFNHALYRLGYGGGYYDRTLAGLKSQKTTTAIGIGFECQLVDKLPVGSHDIRLDCVATEARLYN